MDTHGWNLYDHIVEDDSPTNYNQIPVDLPKWYGDDVLHYKIVEFMESLDKLILARLRMIKPDGSSLTFLESREMAFLLNGWPQMFSTYCPASRLIAHHSRFESSPHEEIPYVEI